MDASEIEESLGLWPGTAGGRATLINVSENHTYRIDAPAGCSVLRLHRPGYQTENAIRSELALVDSLRGKLRVPKPLKGRNGDVLQSVGRERTAVLFDFEPGLEPPEEGDLRSLFTTLGRYAATLHRHVQSWTPPDTFERLHWHADSILDPDGLWGDWRRAPGVAGDVAVRLAEVDVALRDRLARYGENSHNYGLIHADMRLANVLVDGDRVTLIDFDDCGFCWFVYDLAASLSFIETRPDLAELISAWRDGYEKLRPLRDADVAMIGPMIVLRRMALTAWIGSHAETDLARKHAPRFAADTAALADHLLA